MEQPNKPPISYLCTKVILQHMSFSLRTRVAQQCPALAPLHKSIPVQIHNIILAPSKIVIDDTTTLNLSVVCIPKTGETSRYLRLKNKEGGWNYDIDEYGFRELEDAIRDTEIARWEGNGQKMKEELENDLKTSNPMFHEVIKNKYERSHGNSVFKLEMYNLKKAGQPSPFNKYIRLEAVSSSKSYCRVEYINYDGLSKSMYSLISKLFGSLNDNTIRIGNIRVEKDGVYILHSISLKIDYYQFPVKSITTVGSTSGKLDIFEHTDIHTIENCSLHLGSTATRIHFRNSTCHSFEFHRLIESLKRKPIGIHVSIETNLPDPEWLSSIPNSVKGTILVDGNRITCYTVEDRKKRMEINCYYIPKPNNTS